jgi:hypothetical protein
MRTHHLTLCILLLTLALPAWCGNLTISRVWPEKLCFKPGEAAKLDVDVANSGAAAVDAAVTLAVLYGLDGRDDLTAQALTVPAKGKATATFTYPIPADRKWGHEVIATVAEPGAEALTGHEYFTVGRNPWEVGHYLTLFYIRGAKKSGAIDQQMMPKYRKSYTTCLEAYSIMPSQFDDMTPDTDIWRSGQGWYAEGKEDWLYLVQRAHENGMAVVTYIQSISYGPVGFDFARRHPDWLTFSKEGRPNAWFDVDQLTKDRYEPEAQDPHTPGGISCGSFLPTKQVVGDYWINEVAKSKEMFGWDGFRSDGTPGITDGYDVTGKLQEVADKGHANAEFVRKLRRELTAKFPDFLYGWNNVAGGYPQMYNSEEEEDVMLPGAYSLYEHFNSASQPSSPYHQWKKGAFYLQQEAIPIRRRGGFPHAGWMGSNRYLEAVASASGQQIDGWGGPGDWPNYRRFEFRWAEYLWDCALRFVRPGSDAARVEGPERVWWEDLVNARDLPGGGKRVVVNLVNLPEKDDDGWADRAPAPAENVKVTFAVPPGKALAKLAVLSPDTPGDVVPVKPAGDGSVTVPSVTVWTVVVAEFK